MMKVGIPKKASLFPFRNGRRGRKRSSWSPAMAGCAADWARPCSRRAGRMGTGMSKGGDMRYPKGSIVLSDTLDVPALRKVYQAGHATAWQLYRALNPVSGEGKWKSFVRRLGILSERHFLLRLVVDGMAAPVFALGDEGARSLQGRLPTLIEAGPRDSNRGGRHHV